MEDVYSFDTLIEKIPKSRIYHEKIIIYSNK